MVVVELLLLLLLLMPTAGMAATAAAGAAAAGVPPAPPQGCSMVHKCAKASLSMPSTTKGGSVGGAASAALSRGVREGAFCFLAQGHPQPPSPPPLVSPPLPWLAAAREAPPLLLVLVLPLILVPMPLLVLLVLVLPLRMARRTLV